MIRIFFSLAIAFVLLAMNFYLGLTIMSITAITWGLTTDHWKPKHLTNNANPDRIAY